MNVLSLCIIMMPLSAIGVERTCVTQSVSGEYTAQDYVLANRLHVMKDTAWPAFSAILAVFLVGSIVLLIFRPAEVLPWFFIFVCLCYISYPYTILPFRSRSFFNQQTIAQGKIEIRFEPTQIIDKSSSSEGSLDWLHHYLISDKIILLYSTRKTFIMLPRRFFKDDAQFDEVKKFLQTFPTGKRMTS